MQPNQIEKVSTDRIKSILRKVPAPIIHNHRLGNILFEMITQLPDLKRKYQMPGNVDIITCHSYIEKSLFERSLSYLGLENYTVLQEAFVGPWRNTLKLKWILEYLESNRHGEKYVLFCDASDCALIGDPYKILETFKRKKCRLLFMSTSFMGGYACMPEVKKWADYIRPGRYLNSGVFIGERDFLVTVLREAGKYITDNDITPEESRRLGHGVFNKRLCERLPDYPKGCQDQDILRYIHPEFYPEMQIDYDSELAFRNL